MRIVYRQGDREHAFGCDADSGRILGVVARRLPAEVAVLCHNGTARRPEAASRGEVAAAARAVLRRLEADPGLLFRYAATGAADPRPSSGHFGRGSSFGGIRFADTPDGKVYAVKCGPGHCDLEEIAVGADGRGTVVAVSDLRPRAAIETANLGVLRLHRKPSKTRLRAELEALLSAVEGWPEGAVNKVMDTGGADEDD